MAPSNAVGGKGRSGSGANTTKMTQNPIATRQMNRRASKTEKPIFKDLIFSIAGIVTGTGGDIIPADKIAGWIRAHGGVYVQEVNDDTTHLICSIKEYQKNGPQVQKARKLNSEGHRRHIVVFDWLEDCLIPSNNKKRRRKETQYTLDVTIKRLRNGFKRQEDSKNKFEEGVKASKELCDSKLHKVYFESDGFEYNVVISRIDVSNEKVRTQRYTLYIFESIAKPHHYMFGAKLSQSHRPTTYHRDHCQAMTLDKALHKFKHFFHDKTGIFWDDRLTALKVDGKFVYTRPGSGQATGSLPDGHAQHKVQVASKRSYQDTTNSNGSCCRYDSPAPTSGATEVPDGSEPAKREPESEGAIQHSLVDVYSEYGYQPNVPRQHGRQ